MRSCSAVRPSAFQRKVARNRSNAPTMCSVSVPAMGGSHGGIDIRSIQTSCYRGVKVTSSATKQAEKGRNAASFVALGEVRRSEREAAIDGYDGPGDPAVVLARQPHQRGGNLVRTQQ